MNMNEIAAVQISKEIHASFEILARETHTSKGFHIERALKNYLKQFKKSDSASIQVINTSAPEPDLDQTDVTIQSRHVYQAQLEKAKAANKRKKVLNSPFFGSSSVDLGYTDASSTDKIIAGDN